jgi:hypothetical protein
MKTLIIPTLEVGPGPHFEGVDPRLVEVCLETPTDLRFAAASLYTAASVMNFDLSQDDEWPFPPDMRTLTGEPLTRGPRLESYVEFARFLEGAAQDPDREVHLNGKEGAMVYVGVMYAVGYHARRGAAIAWPMSRILRDRYIDHTLRWLTYTNLTPAEYAQHREWVEA